MVVVKKFSTKRISKLYPYLLPDTDPEYRRQKIEISQMSEEKKNFYRVIVNNLEGEVSKHTKYFKSLSFVLKPGRCFGIVAHLNAGSLELCKKIAGLDPIVMGEVTVNGKNVFTERIEAQRNLSVSIQKRLINSPMSAYEYLEVLCYCRGVRPKQMPLVIIEVLEMVQMRDLMFNPISSFDRYEIKKLSFAATFIGDIDVIILDQPTAAIDPEAKSSIWNAIFFARSLGKSIVFTTDSLMEAECVCDEMVFLIEGNVVGLSTPVNLRIAFCKGFYIEFRMAIIGSTPMEVEEK